MRRAKQKLKLINISLCRSYCMDNCETINSNNNDKNINVNVKVKQRLKSDTLANGYCGPDDLCVCLKSYKHIKNGTPDYIEGKHFDIEPYSRSYLLNSSTSNVCDQETVWHVKTCPLLNCDNNQGINSPKKCRCDPEKKNIESTIDKESPCRSKTPKFNLATSQLKRKGGNVNVEGFVNLGPHIGACCAELINEQICLPNKPNGPPKLPPKNSMRIQVSNRPPPLPKKCPLPIASTMQLTDFSLNVNNWLSPDQSRSTLFEDGLHRSSVGYNEENVRAWVESEHSWSPEHELPISASPPSLWSLRRPQNPVARPRLPRDASSFSLDNTLDSTISRHPAISPNSFSMSDLLTSPRLNRSKPFERFTHFFRRRSVQRERPPNPAVPTLQVPDSRLIQSLSVNRRLPLTPLEQALHGEDLEIENIDLRTSLHQLQWRNVGWYWGPMSWKEAETVLDAKTDGSFLVRDSSDDRHIFCISFKSQGITKHTRIEHSKGYFSFWRQPATHKRGAIVDFIETAMDHSREGRFLYYLQPNVAGEPPAPVTLLYPVSRFAAVQSLKHMCRYVIRRQTRIDLIETLHLPQTLISYLRERPFYEIK